MNDLPARIRAAVVNRAGRRCEYCGLAQQGQEATFHIDHVVPRAAGGQTTEDNLALACVSCSLHKSAKSASLDPELGEEASLFNPRTQVWTEHFRWEGNVAIGLSSTGRATIVALRMNRPLIVAIRKEESIRGRHPHV